MVRQVGALELAALKAAGGIAILDVRDPWETSLAPFPGAACIPMGQLVARIDELDPGLAWVVVCHHGTRSNQVAHYLARCGFARVMNLQGGVDAWSREVDPHVSRY